MVVIYEWRGAFVHHEVTALHAEACDSTTTRSSLAAGQFGGGRPVLGSAGVYLL